VNEPSRLLDHPSIEVMELGFDQRPGESFLDSLQSFQEAANAARTYLIDNYRQYPFMYAKAYRRIFDRLLADDRIVIHCTAGKDRTGVAIALILEAVGVERPAIVEDYASSERNLAGPWTERMFGMLQAMGIPRTPALDDLVAATPPAAIVTALEWVDSTHGGAAGYLRSGGLTDAELDALRRRLV